MTASAPFDGVADEYDAARPSYPAAVFDGLGPLDGRRVLDVGAGSGIATRELSARGAAVVAVDAGAEILRRAVARTPGLPALVADGARLPVRDGSVDLVCCAQSWHWLDPDRRVAEVNRALRAGGLWAAWWSHARADDETWFDSYWRVIERSCPGTHRGQRDTDWGATIDDPARFQLHDRIIVRWVRHITVEDWLTDQSSHSYVAALTPDARALLLGDLRDIVDARFPDAEMSVPYETWLWTATRR